MIVEKCLFSNELEKSDVVKIDLTDGMIHISAEFVISRNSDGSTLSQYKDDIWDLNPYSESSGRKLNFNNIKTSLHRQEVKRLMLVVIIFSSGRNGTTKAPATLWQYLQFLFVPLAKHAMKNNISIAVLFEKQKYMDSYLNFIQTNETRLSHLMTIISLLKKLGNQNTGIRYIYNNEFNMKLIGLISSLKKKPKQTALIPVSIFLAVASQRWKHIDYVEKNLPILINFLNDCLKNEHYAKIKSNEYSGERWKKYSGFVEWSEAVKSHGLEDFFSYYNICDRKYVAGFLSRFQGTCRHQICAYTGMRHDETKVLRINCFKVKRKDTPSQILGTTKKIHGIPVTMTWVTVPEIKRIIDILRQINHVVLKYRAKMLKDEPLFLKMTFFLKGRDENVKTFKDANAIGKNPETELFLIEEGLIITKKHIKEELNAVEPNRRWEEEEKYMIGKKWHFTYHQYRRSLAVYALGSGLVSLKAMQGQFGHLLHTMTAYYGNGSFAAKSLIGINHIKHINSYMKIIKGEIDFLAYFKNILFSTNTLHGAHGRFKEKHDLQIKDRILMDKRETIKKFKNGSMYYRDTAVGGCVSVEPCDKLFFRSYTACFSCEDGYQTESKIYDTIEDQKSLLINFDPNSVEYRTEKHELDVLEKHYEIIRRKNNE